MAEMSYELYYQIQGTGFEWTCPPGEYIGGAGNGYTMYFTGANNFHKYLPITTPSNVEWFLDEACTIPVIEGSDEWLQYANLYDTENVYKYGGIIIYGKLKVTRVLDENGVKILFNLLSLQDYPNNDVLAAVINAIDTTKLDKNNIFIGTKDEYDNAFRANKVPVGAIVVLTDIEC